jgi:hypothetical protein
MILKHYAINLPADYDMASIRMRVADKGPSYDDFPGLGIKIFMIRERGRHGAQGNQYAAALSLAGGRADVDLHRGGRLSWHH